MTSAFSSVSGNCGAITFAISSGVWLCTKSIPFCTKIHGTIPADCQSDGGLALWQAVNIAGSTEVDADELFIQSPNIQGYVVDGAKYGSGKTFGWEAEEKTFVFPEKLKIQNRQFILAGGLNIENVQTGIHMLHPDVVDVSSGVERDGVKDAALIRKFISAAKHC